MDWYVSSFSYDRSLRSRKENYDLLTIVFTDSSYYFKHLEIVLFLKIIGNFLWNTPPFVFEKNRRRGVGVFHRFIYWFLKICFCQIAHPGARHFCDQHFDAVGQELALHIDLSLAMPKIAVFVGKTSINCWRLDCRRGWYSSRRNI